MAVAGKNAKVYAPGVSTPFVAEPCTQIGATLAYQINTAVKRILDPGTAPVVKVGGVVQPAANIQSINPYFGIVTFKAAPGGAVTVDGAYLPLLAVANIRDVNATMKATMLDATVAGADHKTKACGQKDCSGDFTGLDPFTTIVNAGGAAGDKSFWDWFTNDTPKLLEYDPDGTGTMVLRAWAIFPSLQGKSAVDAMVTRQVNWEGTAPALLGGFASTPASFGAP